MPDWMSYGVENCSVARTLELVGEKWTLHVVRDIFNGIRRFDEMHAHIGLSEAVLSDRLSKLVDAGIVERRPYQEAGRRRRHEYAPTAKGWDLFPILVALMQWGDRYTVDEDGPMLELHHLGCGHPIDLTLRCPTHGPGIDIAAVTASPGPGARQPTNR